MTSWTWSSVLRAVDEHAAPDRRLGVEQRDLELEHVAARAGARGDGAGAASLAREGDHLGQRLGAARDCGRARDRGNLRPASR